MSALVLHCESSVDHPVVSEFGPTTLEYARVIGMTAADAQVFLPDSTMGNAKVDIPLQLPPRIAENIYGFFDERMCRPKESNPAYDCQTFVTSAHEIPSVVDAQYTFLGRVHRSPYLLSEGGAYSVLREERSVHSMIGLGDHRRTLGVLGRDAVLAVASPEALMECYRGESLARVLIRPKTR